MARATLTLTVIEDHCLGHKVYRGTAKANELIKASWIDRHDIDLNQFGYQRALNKPRSERAARYANEVEGAFWPECIFALRDNVEGTNEDEKVDFTFTPLTGTDGRFGTLLVNYNPEGNIAINGTNVPWKRALSQVDCQHRLGSLEGTDHPITFCIFPGLSQLEEAIIFRTINDTQRKMPTSLVDSILLVTNQDASPHAKWAWDLGRDVGSPFYRLVWTGGSDSPTHITLRGLKEALRRLMPSRLVKDEDPEYCYIFARNYWLAIKNLWPDEFDDPAHFKLQTTSGQGGIAAFGQRIFKAATPTQEIGQAFIERFFKNDLKSMDWSNAGPLRLATGKGGQKNVVEELEKVYAPP